MSLFLVQVPRPPRLILAIDALSLISSFWLGVQLGYPPISIFLFAVSIAFSTHVLCLALQQGWKSLRSFNWGCLALPAWYLAAFVFQYGVMFTATRYVLFLAPPAILIAMRATTPKPQYVALGWALAANLLLVVSIAVGDLIAADLYRAFAGNEMKTLRETQNTRVFFAGHWGFQYYAERAGGELIDKRNGPQLKPGDLVVIAKMPWPSLLQPAAAAGLKFERRSLSINRSWPIRTLSCGAGVLFYGNAISGCARPTLLPFGFSSEPWEEFLVYQTRKTENIRN
jgi:hypothetical protein